MSVVERVKDRKRHAILQAAQELFSAHGFDRVSINEIADSASVSPGTVYNHFGTKHNLMREVVESLIRALLDKYRTIISSEMAFPEKIETIVFDKARVASQFRGELLRTAYESSPDIRDLVEQLWHTEFDQLTVDLLEQGKSQGYVDHAASRDALMLYLDVVRSGTLANTSRLADPSLAPGVIEEFNLLVLYGLMGTRGRPDVSR